jgi:hypothetical protein
MSRFDHSLFIYISLETTNKDRFSLSRHLELPTVKDMIERIAVTSQLIEIGLKSLAWAGNPGGKPWRKMVAGNVGGF